jgi:GINS complex subunit 4
MEIDDILASVDHTDISSPESTALDHQLLTRFWVAERSVPELLPWPARLMERMMERVRQQVLKPISTPYISAYRVNR